MTKITFKQGDGDIKPSMTTEGKATESLYVIERPKGKNPMDDAKRDLAESRKLMENGFHVYVAYEPLRLHPNGFIEPGGTVIIWENAGELSYHQFPVGAPHEFTLDTKNPEGDKPQHPDENTDEPSRLRSKMMELAGIKTPEIEYMARVAAIRQYCQKNGFCKIALGASGGIDSALVLTMAADAIGGENVLGIAMPSKFSSPESERDAQQLMENLGGEFRTIPIQNMVDSIASATGATGVAYENVQARVRGMLVMSVSNQEGHLVLVPGNMSEGMMGYFTMYGDSVGGFAPLRYATKTLVYEMARWRNGVTLNGISEPIPLNSIERPPSAELAEGQKDSDSLPDYRELDWWISKIIQYHALTRDGSGNFEDVLASEGVPREIYNRILNNAWKRRQLADGPFTSAVTATPIERGTL